MRAWLSGVLSRWIDRTFLAGLSAAAEALYPPGDSGAPDGVATDLVARNTAYIRRMPTSTRVQLTALYVALELFTPILAPFGPRFSRRTPAQRLAVIMGWRHSRVYGLRLLGNAVHAQLQMLYLSHPAVVHFIGEYKPVDYPDDPFRVDIAPVPEGL